MKLTLSLGFVRHGISNGKSIEIPAVGNAENIEYSSYEEETMILQSTIQEFRSNPVEIPIVINGKEVVNF